MHQPSLADRLFRTSFVLIVGAALGYLLGMLGILMIRYSADLGFAAYGLLVGNEATTANTARTVREFWQGPLGQMAFYLGPVLGAAYLLKKEWQSIWPNEQSDVARD